MPKPSISQREFISLMACLMSLAALSIDSILPALLQISSDLHSEDGHLILSFIFLGMAPGLLLYGPLADSFGRKPILMLGMVIYIIGSLISLFAWNYEMMLVGRFAQGFGAAACRIVSLAMIRDLFQGQQMGKVMSMIMVFFIMVPALAPSIGQGILFLGHWRWIFLFGVLFALGCMFWLHVRQRETLASDNRRPFSISSIADAVKQTFSHPVTRLYMLASGIMFGSFVGYLSSSQQVLQVHYGTGDAFALYFGGLALAIGLSSFTNSKLVMHFNMANLCLAAIAGLTVSALLFLLVFTQSTFEPSLPIFLAYLTVTFFCFGILFGNLNTLAVQPLGHIAGTANSVIASIQTFISVGIGSVIGGMYNDSVMPMVWGFFLCGACSVVLATAAKRKLKTLSEPS